MQRTRAGDGELGECSHKDYVYARTDPATSHDMLWMLDRDEIAIH